MRDGSGPHPPRRAGSLGLAGIIVLAFSLPIFYVSSYWLDSAASIVFVLVLLVGFGLLYRGLRHSA